VTAAFTAGGMVTTVRLRGLTLAFVANALIRSRERVVRKRRKLHGAPKSVVLQQHKVRRRGLRLRTYRR